MADFYVPIYFNWVEDTAELNDQEKGRLIDAIVLYARGDDWHDRIKGNEKYVFPILKGNIDRQRDISLKRATAGSKGGQQKQANSGKLKQIVANPSKPKQVVAEKDLPDKDKDKDEKKYKEKNKDEDERRTSAHTPVDDVVIGIDGFPLDLSRVQHLNDAEILTKRFKLPQTENVIEAIADDIQTNGFEAVQQAMTKASESDVRGGLSLNYYRAVLTNSGKKQAVNANKFDKMQNHTIEERRQSIRKAVIDFDSM